MTAQDYIQSKLEELKKPVGLEGSDDSEEAIYRILLSKKFRKYSASEDLQEHIRNAIHINVEKGEPINITFVHGAYKLWRLEESPEADWAELFSLMYYTNWVKGICEIYEPGVWFDFFVDDLIVPKLDNIDISEIEAYIESYQGLIDFVKPYQPDNLRMTITTVGSRFESPEAFDESLERNTEKVKAQSGLPELDEAQRAMVELNVKTTPEQLQDPKWREKVFLIHAGYNITKGEPGYHRRPDKIVAFTQPIPMAIAVGTTKDSIMKFWVGVGVLKPKEESYRQIILSSNQLGSTNYRWEEVAVNGLNGKNFKKVRIT